MAIFTINNRASNRPSTTLVRIGTTTRNNAGNIGSIPYISTSTQNQNTGVFKIVPTSNVPYNNTSPIYQPFTTSIAGQTITLNGNIQNPPLNNTVTIRGTNTATAMRTGGFNFFTGKFTQPIGTTTYNVCSSDTTSTSYVTGAEIVTADTQPPDSCVQGSVILPSATPTPTKSPGASATPTGTATPTPTRTSSQTPTPTTSMIPTATGTSTPTPTPSTSEGAFLINWTSTGAYAEQPALENSNWPNRSPVHVGWQWYAFRNVGQSITGLNDSNGWQGAGFDQENNNSYCWDSNFRNYYNNSIVKTRTGNGTTQLVDPYNSNLSYPINIDKIGEVIVLNPRPGTTDTGVIGNNHLVSALTSYAPVALNYRPYRAETSWMANYSDNLVVETGDPSRPYAINPLFGYGHKIHFIGAGYGGDYVWSYSRTGGNCPDSTGRYVGDRIQGDFFELTFLRKVTDSDTGEVLQDDIFQANYIKDFSFPDWCTEEPGKFASSGCIPLYTSSHRIDPNGNTEAVQNYLFKRTFDLNNYADGNMPLSDWGLGFGRATIDQSTGQMQAYATDMHTQEPLHLDSFIPDISSHPNRTVTMTIFQFSFNHYPHDCVNPGNDNERLKKLRIVSLVPDIIQ